MLNNNNANKLDTYILPVIIVKKKLAIIYKLQGNIKQSISIANECLT